MPRPRGVLLALLLANAAEGAALATRLDALLVNRGLLSSRDKAKTAIAAGLVTVDGAVARKPALKCDDEAELVVGACAEGTRFVSRAGDKLSAALSTFGVDVGGATVLDIGASTGGFSDCALQAGAAAAVCVDVGSEQLHHKLRDDARQCH